MARSLLRLLIVALVALAVPLQGMAAVAAGQCMALGHHHDASPADGHAHDDHADGHDDGGGKSSHCGPCAACCAGSASIAAAAILLIVTAPSSAKQDLSQLPPRGVQLDRLDRPPLAL